jgi:dihydroorotase
MSGPDLIVANVLWEGQPRDVLIREKKILDLVPCGQGADIPCAERVDGGGLTLLPSLIDAHVHLREPGLEYKEDIASGLRAAAGGGFGQVMPMANTDPVNDSGDTVRFMLDQARRSWPDGPHLRPVGGLTKGLQGRELAPMHELASAGCVAFSNDGLPIKSTELFRRAMEYAADLGIRVIDHCEDHLLGQGGVMNEGRMSGLLGVKGIPTVSEAVQVARDILLSEYLNIPIHLAHISCRESLDLIRGAKERGVPVTAETCPHYLLWDEELLDGYNTLAKVNPPLRTQRDVESMRQAVRDGVIDILVTDHAPHADHEKEVPLCEAPNGISGLDTALSLTYGLVRDGVLSPADLIRLWCTAPAHIYSLPANGFRPGDPADFILFDSEASWEVTAASLLSKGKNTPCLGTTLPGRVMAHYLDGTCVFSR